MKIHNSGFSGDIVKGKYKNWYNIVGFEIGSDFVSVTKPMGNLSFKLMDALRYGHQFSKVTIDLCKENVTIVKITLTNCYIVTYDTFTVSSYPNPLENIVFKYETIKNVYNGKTYKNGMLKRQLKIFKFFSK
jgi:type VI protein secretion system component Hcp